MHTYLLVPEEIKNNAKIPNCISYERLPQTTLKSTHSQASHQPAKIINI